MNLFKRFSFLPKTFKVEITAKDIENSSSYYSDTYCPFALALKRKFPFRKISVLTDTFRIGDTRYEFDDTIWNSEVYYKAVGDELFGLTLIAEKL